MGQYHYVCNLTKGEYLDAHQHGDGIKLMEFAQSSGGTMTALAVLLSASNGRGSGDYRGDAVYDGKQISGRWSGDRISIIGDYHAPADVPGFTDTKPVANTPWTENDVLAEFDLPAWTCISSFVQAALNSAGEGRV